MQYIAATDGSRESDRAITHAVEHAVALGVDLEIVHVLTPRTRLEGGQAVFEGWEAAIDPGKQTLERAERLALDAAEAESEGTDIAIDTVLLEGRPADAITDRARETGAEAIYVGHRGLSEKREEVVGSVAKGVIDQASVPVTVVR